MYKPETRIENEVENKPKKPGQQIESMNINA
jgi:hypothetical protein